MTRTSLWITALATTTACTMPAQNPGNGDPTAFTRGVSTLAGSSQHGDIDGDRESARLSNPVNVLIGPDRTLYVADFDNGRIRTIDPAGKVDTLIAQPGFQRPFGLAMSGGTLYVETDNAANGAHSLTSGTIWRVDVASKTATVIATDLGRPRGLAVLPDGELAVSDYAHHVVMRLDPTTGTHSVIAGAADAPGYVDGDGADARFTAPYGLAVRSDGMLIVADFGNQRLRLVDPSTGATSTFAGNGTAGFVNGPLLSAELSGPQGVAIDAAGDVFVSDTANYRVREIQGDAIDTVAGNGTGGFLDADDRLASELYGLEGLAVSADGVDLYVADGNRGDGSAHNRVRIVDMTP
jgi:sugar lactone lactonase YvrE